MVKKKTKEKANKKINKKTKAKENKKDSLMKKEFRLSNKVSALDIALSIRHLSTMLKAGMSLAESVRTLVDQTDNSLLKEQYEEIHRGIIAGKTMADSMKKYPKTFTNIIHSIVSVGEQGGTLEKNLIFLADYLKKDYELRKKVKGALIYPMIVFGITLAEMVGVIFFILPTLESLFSTMENIPAYTVFIMNASAFIRGNILTATGFLIVFGIIFWRGTKTKVGKIFADKLKLKIPIIKKLTRKSILTNYSRTLGILIESGIPITESLHISSKTMGNYVYEEAMKKITVAVEGGKTLSHSMKKTQDLFPPTYIKMVQVGEETGTLEENLLYLYDFYAEEVDEMSSNLATILEPLLLIFIGLMIGGLAIIIIGPIYQLTGSING